MKEPEVAFPSMVIKILSDFSFAFPKEKEKKQPTAFIMFTLTYFSYISNYYLQLVLPDVTYDEYLIKTHCTLKEFNRKFGQSAVQGNLHGR